MKTMTMWQQQNVVSSLSLLLFYVPLLIAVAEADPYVWNQPRLTIENTWNTLQCEGGQQWQCSSDRHWEVQRDGARSEPVEFGNEIVMATSTGFFSGQLDVFLNNRTKGIYRCYCTLANGQTEAPRAVVYLYSEAQRFSFPEEVLIEEDGTLNVSVRYLPFVLEAATLERVMLVDEATEEISATGLVNSTGDFSVRDRKPGSYHFEVSPGALGHISSASFNATIKVPETDPPPTAAGPLDGWVNILIAVILTVGAIVVLLLCLVMTLCALGVLKCKKDKRGNVQGMVPLIVVHDNRGAGIQVAEVGGHVNVHREDDVDERHPLGVVEDDGSVNENPHFEDDGSVDENPHREDDGSVDENPHREDNGSVDENPHRDDDGSVDENPHRDDDGSVHENPHREDDGSVDKNPHRDADGSVDENPHREDNGSVDENPHGEDDGDELLPLPEEVASAYQVDAALTVDPRHDAVVVPDPVEMSERAAEEESPEPPQEEQFRVTQNRQIAEQCTDHNNMLRGVDEVHRRAPSRSSDGAESIKRPWLQPSSSRSETDHSVVTDVSCQQSSVVKDVPKSFN